MKTEPLKDGNAHSNSGKKQGEDRYAPGWRRKNTGQNRRESRGGGNFPLYEYDFSFDI